MSSLMASSSRIRPKALLFDVFGTVVNWRLTVCETLKTRATTAISSPEIPLSSTLRLRVSTTDWATFADQWRSSYIQFTQQYSVSTGSNDGQPFFKTVDQHHYESLVELIKQYEFQNLWSSDEVSEISMIWHFLAGWPDSSAGLEGLRKLGVPICTLSNANVSLLTDMANFAHLPWNRIFSSEQFGLYKPSPEVYEGAVKKLGLKSEECAMVAAHLADLWAARKCGLKTIYVEREHEERWTKERVEATRREGWVDIWVGLEDGGTEARGILELARILSE